MTGRDLNPQLSASMRRTIVQYARTHPGKPLSASRLAGLLASIALLAGVTATALVIVVAGLPHAIPSPPIADTPTATASPTQAPSPSPSPSESSPPSTPIAGNSPTQTPAVPGDAGSAPDLVAGFDARQLWNLCVARGQAEFPGSVVTSDYDLRFVRLTPDGIPEVSVSFDTPDQPMPTGTIWVCRFGGDPASPVVEYFTAKDI